jgi:hypothetical protein
MEHGWKYTNAYKIVYYMHYKYRLIHYNTAYNAIIVTNIIDN